MRLDLEIVKRGLLPTRSKAKDAILTGKVYYNGVCITKPSFEVEADSIIECKDSLKYVSKGGLKLEKAINDFGLNLKGQVLLDIGASTGGFTDCALQNGVSRVIAVDVGANQMHPLLRENPKIKLYENTDFRNMDFNLLSDVTIASIDVSFISVSKLNYRLRELNKLKTIVCLIKPQFECGKQVASKYKGVIKDKDVHYTVINSVIESFKQLGFEVANLTYSPITGGDGNIEYLALFQKTQPSVIDIKNIIEDAFRTLT